MKRLYLILAIAVVLLTSLAIFFFSGHDYRHDLEAYKQDLLAHGENLTALELAQPLDTNDTGPAKRFMAFMTNYTLPTNLVVFGMRMVGPGRAQVMHTRLTAADMLGYESNQSNIAALRASIDGKPLNFALDYSNGVEILLPHVAKAKSVVQLHLGTAIQGLYSHHYDEAFQNLVTGIDYVSLPARDHILISELVLAASAQMAFRATWDFLQERRWTDQQLARLQESWQQVALPGAASQFMRMERAMMIDAFEKCRRMTNGDAAFGIVGSGSAGSSGNPLDDLKNNFKEWWNNYPRFWRWRRSWSYEEELVYLKKMAIVIHGVDQQRESGSFFPAFTQMNQALTSFDATELYHTNHILLTGGDPQMLAKSLTKIACAQAAITITYTAIALERYHLARNAYPEKLDQLVPAYIEKVPTDFMDGKPLRYSLRKDGTFLLYSVGSDGVDDGGDPSGGMPDWTKGLDIVWPTAVQTNSPGGN